MLKKFLLGLMIVCGLFGIQQGATAGIVEFEIKAKPSLSEWYPGKLIIEGYMAVPLDQYMYEESSFIDCFYSGWFEFGCKCSPTSNRLQVGYGNNPALYMLPNSRQVRFPAADSNPGYPLLNYLYTVKPDATLEKLHSDLPSGDFIQYNAGRGAYEIRFKKTWKPEGLSTDFDGDGDTDAMQTWKVELYDFATSTWKIIYNQTFWIDHPSDHTYSTQRMPVTFFEVWKYPNERLQNRSITRCTVGFRDIKITYNKYPYGQPNTVINLDASNSGVQKFNCGDYSGYCGLNFTDYWQLFGNNNEANWQLRWIGPTQ